MGQIIKFFVLFAIFGFALAANVDDGHDYGEFVEQQKESKDESVHLLKRGIIPQAEDLSWSDESEQEEQKREADYNSEDTNPKKRPKEFSMEDEERDKEIVITEPPKDEVDDEIELERVQQGGDDAEVNRAPKKKISKKPAYASNCYCPCLPNKKGLKMSVASKLLAALKKKKKPYSSHGQSEDNS